VLQVKSRQVYPHIRLLFSGVNSHIPFWTSCCGSKCTL